MPQPAIAGLCPSDLADLDPGVLVDAHGPEEQRQEAVELDEVDRAVLAARERDVTASVRVLAGLARAPFDVVTVGWPLAPTP